MYLHSLTIQQTTGITQSITGNFSSSKSQEICICRGTILELLKPDPISGKLITLISKETFGQIRKIIPFRLIGNNRDFIIVGSDSGRVVVLEADADKKEFIKIHQETFGKTGCRRIVPGEYLAADPKGRTIMIAAIEKQKFVYILNRDNENKMTISSPLDAHKGHTICFDICGLDVGYENPLFACLEVDYGDPDSETSAVVTGEYTKLLTYYEMDLGLNHVVRKNFDKIDQTAHLLIPVFGSGEGPGGVLVCCENKLIYKQKDTEIVCPFPRRHELPREKGIMIVNFTSYKKKDYFFFLLQSEFGDIYKVSFEATSDIVHGILIQYFDTIPVCVSLNLIAGGEYLFAASEISNHAIYQVKDIVDKDNSVATYSAMISGDTVGFNPKTQKNLIHVDEIPSLSCINDMIVEDLVSEGSPQIYTLCGKGTRSTLRILRHGLQVNDMASNPLPGKPVAVWTLKDSITDEFDKYVVVSFTNATLVLSIGEKNVSEVKDSGFDLKKPSLHVGLMEDGSFIQIYPNGIIHIRKDTKKRNLYQTNSKILCACSNQRQILVALQDKEIMYFELDGTTGALNTVEKKVLDSDVVCLDIGPIPVGRTRCRFVAIGFADSTIKIYSLDIDTCLARLSFQSLPETIESVSLVEMKNSSNLTEIVNEDSELFLHIGLSNGVLMRTSVDNVTGKLSDTRTRYLGNRGVSLFKIFVQNSPSLIAVSSKPWLCYNYMSKYLSTNLNTEPMDYVSSFCSEQVGEGVVALVNGNLKIFCIERLGEFFNQTSIELRYTPRKLLLNPDTNNLIIIEADTNTYSKREKDSIKKEIAERTKDPEYLAQKEERIGVPYAGEGKWGSCIRMIEPYEQKLLDLIELEENEAAFSGCIMSFASNPNEIFLIVGTAKDMLLHPRSCSSASIITFLFKDNGKKIEFVHRTVVEELPMAFCEFQGRLLAGVGSLLRIYELGKKKLLKKCETKKLTSTITGISLNGQRIFVNTMSESFHVLRYKPNENQLYLFSDDVLPRWLCSSVILDYDTIAGTDKFENFFVCRLPQGCDEESEEDPMGTKHKWEIGYLNGAAFKMSQIAQFHRGELITSIKKCNFSPEQSNKTILIYGTSMGSIGVFIPHDKREDVDFFVHLEMYLRLEAQSISGRDHQSYRSAYEPVKSVIDGDLCEQFSSLDATKQKVLAGELDKTPGEILKKLEDIRNKIV